jgi:hypothetical protein
MRENLLCFIIPLSGVTVSGESPVPELKRWIESAKTALSQPPTSIIVVAAAAQGFFVNS